MLIKKYKLLFICLVGFFFVSPTTVFAGAENGFYLGAGIGDSSIEASGSDPNGGNYSFDENDSGYKIFGGYNFGIVPFIDVAIEASYVDFGNPSGVSAQNTPLGVELTGINAFGLVGFSFGPFGLFAKAGMIDWESDTSVAATSISDSGTDAAYGVGARFQLSSLAIRAEYEVYDISSTVSDLTMYSVSAVYTF